MDFVIDRAIWRCGGNADEACGLGETSLQNELGYRCCLGQIAVQLGVEEKNINSRGQPQDLDYGHGDKLIDILIKQITPTRHEDEDYDEEPYYLDTILSNQAMQINDNERLNETERESALQELFKEYGHSISFTGEYVKG